MEQASELMSAADVPALFLQYHGALVAYASRYLGPDQGEDVAQDAWFRLLRALQTGTPLHLAGIKPWLFRVTGNLVKDALRRKHLMAFLPLDEVLEMPDTQEVETEVLDRDIVQRLFAHLHPHEQRLLTAVAAGDTYAELAADWHVPASTIKARLYWARQAAARWREQEAS